MNTLDLRKLNIADNFAGANCREPWTDPDWWTAPEITGPHQLQERRAKARDDARALCDDCPAAVTCLLIAALKQDTGTIVAGLFGADLKRAYKALEAGADPRDLIGGGSR